MRRTNIEIDEEKLSQIKALTGAETIKDAVDRAFAELIRINRQRQILAHRGMAEWDGDLEQMRQN
jgi:Arc/MetJ family transcription regulator